MKKTHSFASVLAVVLGLSPLGVRADVDLPSVTFTSITASNGHAVTTLDDLQERISGYAAGDQLKLAVTGGDGAKRTVTLTVGSIPAQRQPLATGC